MLCAEITARRQSKPRQSIAKFTVITYAGKLMTDAMSQAVATPEELAESRRRCWHGNCTKTARLDWCGWRFCIPHYWTRIIRDADGLGQKLLKIRYTKVIWRRIR